MKKSYLCYVILFVLNNLLGTNICYGQEDTFSQYSILIDKTTYYYDDGTPYYPFTRVKPYIVDNKNLQDRFINISISPNLYQTHIYFNFSFNFLPNIDTIFCNTTFEISIEHFYFDDNDFPHYKPWKYFVIPINNNSPTSFIFDIPIIDIIPGTYHIFVGWNNMSGVFRHTFVEFTF